MLKSTYQISILFLLCNAVFPALAQVNPYAKIQKTTLIESQNDSMDLATDFWTIVPNSSEEDEGSIVGLYDDPEEDFFDEESDEDVENVVTVAEMTENLLEYQTFDIKTVHYPKFDFSKKQDTTLIPLLAENQVYAHPCNGHVTSHFGMRRRRYHYGVDMKGRTGDSIFSIFDGTVRIAQRSRTYGFLVVVRHDNGLETYYAHLSRLLVEPEQEVKAGELIGLCGNTGRSSGSHLHFETRYLGAPINPEDIIDFEKHELKSPNLELCAHNFRYLPIVNKLKQSVYHRVKSGETLGSIAGRYRTSVSGICRLNRIRSTSILRVGQRLRVR